MTAVGGGETAADPSGWTTDTVLAYVQRIIAEQDRRIEQRFDAVIEMLAAAERTHATERAADQEALRIARRIEEEHFRELNGARERSEGERTHFAQVDVVGQQIARLGERQEQSARALGERIDQVVVHVDDRLREQGAAIEELRRTDANTTGRRLALTAAIAFAFPAIGLAIALVTR